MKARLQKEGRRLDLTAPFRELEPVRGVLLTWCAFNGYMSMGCQSNFFRNLFCNFWQLLCNFLLQKKLPKSCNKSFKCCTHKKVATNFQKVAKTVA